MQDFKGSCGVGLWQEISKEMSHLKHYNMFLNVGSRIRFWEDA